MSWSRRKCPIAGCTSMRRHAWPLCRYHLRFVPAALRARLERLTATRPRSPQHDLAIEDAIESVLERLDAELVGSRHVMETIER